MTVHSSSGAVQGPPVNERVQEGESHDPDPLDFGR